MEQIHSMYPILSDSISPHSHRPLHSSATVLMFNEKNRCKTDKGRRVSEWALPMRGPSDNSVVGSVNAHCGRCNWQHRPLRKVGAKPFEFFFWYSLTHFPGLNAHIMAQPSVDNHRQAGQTREQLRRPTTSQSSSSSTVRSLAQQRRRERERASLQGFVQLATPPSTQRDLRQSDGAFHFSFNSSLRSHMLSRSDTKRSTHDPSTRSGSPQSE